MSNGEPTPGTPGSPGPPFPGTNRARLWLAGLAAIILLAVAGVALARGLGARSGTPAATATPRARHAIATPTAAPATATPTPVPPTATRTPAHRKTVSHPARRRPTATPRAPAASSTPTPAPTAPIVAATATPRTLHRPTPRPTPAATPSLTPSSAAVTSTPTAPPAVESTATSTAGPTGQPAQTATSHPPARATETPTSSPMASPTPSATGTSTSRPTATATATETPTATPQSLEPAYSSYTVGTYYFSGWSHGPNNNITSVLTGPMHASEPLIGWYDDSQSQLDKSIDQAANAGIDFFAFDWYDIARSPYRTDRTLNEGLSFYLTSRERHRLKFCLTFIDQAPFIPRAADWPGLVKMWIRYFRQPDYVRVNGKPLLIVFSPEHMREIFGGSAGVHRALDYLRGTARAAGLPGVTVAVAATVAPRANPEHVYELNIEGYDAATGYNYHSMGGEQYDVPVPYSHLVAENVAMWSRVASRVHVPYFPVITSGFDLRFSAREQKTAIIYAGRTPARFTCYAVLARHWIDTHPRQTVKERIVMVYAWNEVGEGGGIIPDHRDGYAYANAVRTVFGGPGTAPSTPASCQHALTGSP